IDTSDVPTWLAAQPDCEHWTCIRSLHNQRQRSISNFTDYRMRVINCNNAHLLRLITKGSPKELWPICGQNSQHATDSEWYGMGTDVKRSKFSGGCNFRKGKYLRFCRAYHSGP